MSPQTSEQIKASPPATPPSAVTATPPATGGVASGGKKPWVWAAAAPPVYVVNCVVKLFRGETICQKSLRWALLSTGIWLNISIVALAIVLFVSNPKKIESDNPIPVPYAGAKDVLDQWRSYPVQASGRPKPFGTYAEETVREITGRTKFEGKDPVAVVLSWMMMYQGSPLVTDYDGMKAVAARLECKNWEEHDFILCDFQELREKIFLETAGSGKTTKDLTPEQRHGKYLNPRTIRASQTIKDLVRNTRERRIIDDKASLSMLESKAEEVERRLHTFERARNGSHCGAVVLDEVGETWFPLGAIRTFVDKSLDITVEGRKIDASVRWDERLNESRKKNPERFKGKPLQAYPQESVEKVAAAFENVRAAYQTGDVDRFAEATGPFLKTVETVSASHRASYPETDTIPLELGFNRSMPFRKAWIYCLLGAILLALSVLVTEKFTKLGRALYYGGLAGYIGGLGYAVYGFYCRVSISGRPPVSDMYETIIWVAAVTGLFGLVLELVYRKGFIALASSLVSALGFVLADQLPNTFEPNIKPLNAVLRSNYWLIIHVITIVSSYAAFALAWGLGNLNMGLILYRPQQKDLIRTLSHYSYKAIQIGVILLFLGTMLGGWWAAESWGRFWGWDPKEVWALIAFIFYIIVLHARYVGWVKDFGLAAASVVCFAGVVMAWYGVNFVLGAGLHSYGFGSGNNSWLYLAGLINVSVVVHAGLRYVSRGDHLVAADAE